MSRIPVDREMLLNILYSVSPGLAIKETIDQSSCFVFDKGEVKTFNGEVCCRRSLETLDEAGKILQGAVPSGPLTQILAKFPDTKVSLSVSDTQMTIHGSARKAGLRLEKTVSLPTDAVESPGKWKTLPAEFEEAVSVVSSCASSVNTRPALACINVTPEFVEACDNYQVARYTTDVPIEGAYLIRKDALKPCVGLGMTKVSGTTHWLHLKNDQGLTYSCLRYVDTFPDLSQYLVVKGKPMAMPPGIGEAAEKAFIFSKEGVDDTKATVELSSRKLKVIGRGVSGYFQETIAVTYEGPALLFRVAPELLMELSKKYNTCRVTSDRLKVKGKNYVYVTALSKVEPEGDEDGE